MKYLIIIISLVFFRCNNNEVNNKSEEELVNRPNSESLDSTEIKKQITKEPFVYRPDSMELAYMNGKYFYKQYIRLKPRDGAFIYIDNEYVNTYVKDEAIKELFNKTEYLTAKNREAFYKKIISALPKEDLLIHKMVWDLKEIKKHKRDSDIGYHSVVSILERPNEKEEYYRICIKRDYYNRLGACFPIPFIRIGAKDHKIRVEYDIDDREDIPIKEWRALQ